MQPARFVAASVAVLLGVAAPPPVDSKPPVYADLLGPRPGKAPFAVVGDPQETMFWERIFLQRETNPTERVRLFGELTRQGPEFLVIVGDLTSDGSSERHWRYFDGLAKGLRRAGVPILPVWGNHDYWGSEAKARRALESRFPPLAHGPWYTRAYGRLALVFLDANVAVLSKADWRVERQWFDSTLTADDADTGVDAILVFEHQPPFTNSKVTSDDIDVQRSFVPGFLRARKTVAMISGHTHAYEHFVEHGKHFIVTGGGGGPRVGLRQGGRARHADHYQGPSPRPFHYLWISPHPRSLSVSVVGLAKGDSVFTTIDRFDLVY